MKKSGLIVEKRPGSYSTEVYRMLRTKLHYMSLHRTLKTILITSSKHSEGKSTIACNLSMVLAQSGKKTLLLDCDLRNPSIAQKMSISNEAGLSDLLYGNAQLDDVLYRYSENLHVITSGTIPENPVELLSSEHMKLLLDSTGEKYDFIILDSPPVMTLADTQVLAPIVNGVILVVAKGETDIKTVTRTKELLQTVDADIIGIILNKAAGSMEKEYSEYYNRKQKDRKSNGVMPVRAALGMGGACVYREQ